MHSSSVFLFLQLSYISVSFLVFFLGIYSFLIVFFSLLCVCLSLTLFFLSLILAIISLCIASICLFIFFWLSLLDNTSKPSNSKPYTYNSCTSISLQAQTVAGLCLHLVKMNGGCLLLPSFRLSYAQF